MTFLNRQTVICKKLNTFSAWTLLLWLPPIIMTEQCWYDDVAGMYLGDIALDEEDVERIFGETADHFLDSVGHLPAKATSPPDVIPRHRLEKKGMKKKRRRRRKHKKSRTSKNKSAPIFLPRHFGEKRHNYQNFTHYDVFNTSSLQVINGSNVISLKWHFLWSNDFNFRLTNRTRPSQLPANQLRE